jgi:hypothetical protein
MRVIALHGRRGHGRVTRVSSADFSAESGVPRIVVRAILAGGRNAIGVHGWIHESAPRLEPAEEQRPVGYRALSSAFSAATLDLIIKKRFLWTVVQQFARG